MRSFMYLVEIILVSLLLVSYLYYIKIPENIEKTLYLFERKYQLDTLAIPTIDINKPSFEDLFKIYYLIYFDKLKDFSQNLEKLEIINIYISSREYFENIGCIAFLYPFPVLSTYSYSSKEYTNFVIYNIDGELCKNFTISNDWKILKINNLRSMNISLYFKDLLNLSMLDPYSIFVFDDFGNEIPINAISFDSNYLNISINFNNNINILPIYIIFRIKESVNIENLSYLSGRYSILNNIPGTEVLFLIRNSTWLTIYIGDRCFLKRDLVIKYSVPPSQKFRTYVSNEIQKEKCKGNYSISYFMSNFLEKYDDSKLMKLNVLSEPIKSEYENSIFIINGLNLALLKVYGS